MDVKVSKDKHISRWVDRVKLICRIESKNVHKDDRGKRTKTLSEVKPIENIRKNPVQKEVLPSHKLHDHAYE